MLLQMIDLDSNYGNCLSALFYAVWLLFNNANICEDPLTLI